MSLLYIESFDLFVGPSIPPASGFRWSVAGVVLISSTNGRRGTQAMAPSGYYAPNTTMPYRAMLALDAEESGLVLGFAWKLNAAPFGTAFGEWLRFVSSAAATQFCLDVTAAGRIRVKASASGSVLAETADGALSPNLYHYVEIKFTCGSSADITIHVDGSEVLAASAKNLRQSGAGGVGAIWFTSPFCNQDSLYDDLYLCNRSGGSFDDFQGDVKVTGLLPAGDGTYTDFTSNRATHYDALNDVATSLWDDYHITADTPGDKDSFSLTDPGDMPTVLAVDVVQISSNPDTGTITGRPFLRISGADYNGNSFTRGDTIVYTQNDQMLLNPATGLAWTESDLRNLELGIEFVS